MRLPDALAPIRERAFALMLASRSISTFGSGMAEIALAFAVLDIGGVEDLGLVLLAREIPIVLFLLLGGVWADRLPRNVVIVAADLVRGTMQAAAALLLLTGEASVLGLGALQVGFGVASAFGRPAYTGLVPDLVAVKHLHSANALLGLSSSSLRVAGPALGAAIVELASPGWALAADSASFGASALLLLAIRIPRRDRGAGGSVLSDLREGWREFASRTWVWTMVTSFGLFQLTFFPALLVLGPYVAKTELGGAAAWGTILAAEAAGTILGGLLALRLRFARPLVAMLVLVLPVGAQLALLGLGAPVAAVAAVAFAAGTGLALGDAVWFTTLQQQVPEHALSRISSIDWLGSLVLNPVGYALVGPLAGWTSAEAVLLACAAVNASVSLALLAVPSVRELRAHKTTAVPSETRMG